MLGLNVYTIYGVGVCRHQDFDDRICIQGGDFAALIPLQEVLKDNPQLSDDQKLELQSFVGRKTY